MGPRSGPQHPALALLWTSENMTFMRQMFPAGGKRNNDCPRNPSSSPEGAQQQVHGSLLRVHAGVLQPSGHPGAVPQPGRVSLCTSVMGGTRVAGLRPNSRLCPPGSFLDAGLQVRRLLSHAVAFMPCSHTDGDGSLAPRGRGQWAGWPGTSSLVRPCHKTKQNKMKHF